MTRTPWQTSDRRHRLPADWPVRRSAVKARAHGRCEALVHEPECDGIGTQCDHVIPNDDHSLANLQWLSDPCHLAKTLREAAAASAAARARATRPREQAPGLI